MPLAPRNVELRALADRYLATLLEARRHDAARLILEAIEGGALTISELYLEVFEPVLHEVGRRWQHNEITVAEEHYISAATQLVMSQLYPRIFVTARRGTTMVAACPGAEFHEIGLRMVADLFELAGWDTYYLGANVPGESVVRAVRERRAGLLALSAGLPEHLPHLVEVIGLLRADPSLAAVRILVGGNAFRGDPERWRLVGADGHAIDAAGAVALADALVPAQAADGAP